MANKNKGGNKVKEEVLAKCWNYIHTNFNKFDQPTKVKVALELCKKDIPQEVKGDLFGSAEVAKVIASLSTGDLACLIDACRARASAEKPV